MICKKASKFEYFTLNHQMCLTWFHILFALLELSIEQKDHKIGDDSDTSKKF